MDYISTDDERKRALERAYVINSFDGVEPSDFCKELTNQYVSGDINHEQLIELLVKHHGVDE